MSKFHEKQADIFECVLNGDSQWYLVWSATDDHWWLITEDLNERYRIRRPTADVLFKRNILSKVISKEFDDNHYQLCLFI